MKIQVSIKHGRAAIVAALVATACAPAGERDPNPPRTLPGGGEAARGGLKPFASAEEFAAFVRGHNEAQRERYRGDMESTTAPAMDQASSAPAEAPKAEESVTNVQHAGVDEGGIVKVHGDHLVMLRRGRLFTVAIGGGALRPVSAVDAYAPGTDPSGDWYDELLVSGEQVVVIGYSYARGGTEVGLFRIGRDGALSHQSTYHLRSNDYYSSRNYASRLVDGKLIFYTPLYMNGGDPNAMLPAIRRWRGAGTPDEFTSIVAPGRIYRPESGISAGDALALHTVTVCDLAGGEMACRGTAVVGPPGRVFYTSPGSVYVWLSGWGSDGERGRPASMVYRMPLDGSGPTALGASGSPVDQFSFLESGDGHLNVLVRSDAAGDGMWSAEVAAGDVALMRVPLSAFGDGTASAPAAAYRALPKPGGYTFQNRFVGDFLLYGTGAGWVPEADTAGGAKLYAVRWAGGAPAEIALPHGVDRIEAMGSDAVVVGARGSDLHFSAVRLDGQPATAGRYTLANASQGELRSHGFFYRAEGEDAGMLGLPVAGPGRPGYEHLVEGSASILFLRNRSLRFEEMGQLAARPEGAADDGCRASCVDWYGNARPLFLRGRIFALLGYEIVEGALDGGRIRETRRISYAPGAARTASAPD